MKRELKGERIGVNPPIVFSYTACPNEEGTERARGRWRIRIGQAVTQHVPMKRELKVRKDPKGLTLHFGYTACPNEEGTESELPSPCYGGGAQLHSMSQ